MFAGSSNGHQIIASSWYWLLTKELVDLGIQAQAYANLNQRTAPTLLDISLISKLDFGELRDFCKLLIETPNTTPTQSGQSTVSSIARPIKQHIAPQVTKKQKALPPYPTKHSYLSTNIPLHFSAPTIATREQQKKEKKGIMENLLRIKRVDSLFVKYGVVDVGFVDYTNNLS